MRDILDGIMQSGQVCFVLFFRGETGCSQPVFAILMTSVAVENQVESGVAWHNILDWFLWH